MKVGKYVYGTILANKDGICFKVVGGKNIKGKEYYIVQPLVDTLTVPKNYVEKECDLIKENGFGVEIHFE